MRGRRDSNSEGGDAARPRSPLAMVLRAAEGNRRGLVALAGVALLGGFAEAAVLVMIARLAFALASNDDQVTASLGPLGSVTVSVSALIVVAAVLTLVRIGAQVLQAHQLALVFTRIWTSTRLRLVTLYVEASWALQSGARDGRLQELVTTFATNVAGTVLALASATVALFSLLAFLATAFAVNAIAALVVVAAGVAVGFILRPLRNTLRARARVAASANLEFATDMTELAGHMQEVRVFNVEHEVLGRIGGRINAASTAERGSRFLGLLTPALYQGMALLLVVGAIGVVYATGVTRLGALGGIVLIMVRSLSYGQQLQSSYQALYAAAPYFETLAEEEERYQLAALPKGGSSIDRIGSIVFDHVSFEYTEGRPVLVELDFEIDRGEIVGIIGPSGSGKSTLVQILLRLREPTDGRVLVDGAAATGISLISWYHRVGFVPQDARVFAGSVADNIRFYRNDIDLDAIERAARLANLHDEVMAMAEGYDSLVGERGGQLSGGQRQRLSIARALVDAPDILVLDEPTSALDVKSESLIREALRNLGKDITVVVIAHRLSTLEICDRIMVVHEGRIHGFDTPERLEATDAFYQEALTLSGLR